MAAAQKCRPDILVVDAVLPLIDGLGVVDKMKEMFGQRMPRVIGGCMMPFAQEGFMRRGVMTLVRVPWEENQLAAALDRLAGQGRTPFGVYLTSPDYLGGMQDIAALATVCDAHGVPLLVDNAHWGRLHRQAEHGPDALRRTFGAVIGVGRAEEPGRVGLALGDDAIGLV